MRKCRVRISSGIWFSMLAALAAAVLAACSPRASYPPPPAEAASPGYQYLIGPGDNLNIIVWRNPDLSSSVPVRPDGKLTAPLVEDLPAIGKDSTQLARDIEKQLSKYLRDPVVTVIVTNFVGPYREQVRVVGEATRPQALAYRQEMTLLDVMIAVGGITDFADGNAAQLLRMSEGNKLYSVRLRDLLRRGDLTANVDVKPGDVLVIPQSWF
jgi:polysaccharide biosynthesis/export protein